jgi:hypothetical protein
LAPDRSISRVALLAGVLSGVSLTGCSATRATTSDAHAAQGTSADPRLLKTLAILATGDTPSAERLAAYHAKPGSPQQKLERYVDTLLADARFAGEVAPRLLLGDTLVHRSWLIRHAYVLQRKEQSGTAIYYLREPCTVEAAERVKPWWDLDSEVLVCADSHRPTQFVLAGERRCGIAVPGDPPLCGCGPNLARCFKDAAQRSAFHDSLVNEIKRSVAHVVGKDLPLKTLFTMNESVRDANIEYLYQRARLETGELPAVVDYRRFASQGAPLPRFESAPGQHAGILTMPHLTYLQADRRQRQRIFYEILWCKEATSTGASTAAMLSLGTSNFQVKGEAWRELAARPICTTCHARLDHGVLFFAGYVDGRIGVHFDNSALIKERGQLYGDSIRDPRGEGELTPRAFAELAVQQKEFGQCMVRDVKQHVFGHRGGADTDRALGAVFARSGDLRPLMRAALLQYAEKWPFEQAAATPVSSASAAAAANAEAIAISPRLRALLDQHCVRCHDEAERDFRTATLPRPLAHKMLEQVSFGSMPKGSSGLSRPLRSELQQELIDQLWSDRADRDQAAAYYTTWQRALPVHPLEAAVNVVRSIAGPAKARTAMRFSESFVHPDLLQYTPGYSALTAIEALRACKANGQESEALDRCLDVATAPDNFIH